MNQFAIVPESPFIREPEVRSRAIRRWVVCGFLLGGKDRRSCDGQIEFKPGQFSRFSFIADLSGAELGDAYIFISRKSERTSATEAA